MVAGQDEVHLGLAVGRGGRRLGTVGRCQVGRLDHDRVGVGDWPLALVAASTAVMRYVCCDPAARPASVYDTVVVEALGTVAMSDSVAEHVVVKAGAHVVAGGRPGQVDRAVVLLMPAAFREPSGRTRPRLGRTRTSRGRSRSCRRRWRGRSARPRIRARGAVGEVHAGEVAVGPSEEDLALRVGQPADGAPVESVVDAADHEGLGADGAALRA